MLVERDWMLVNHPRNDLEDKLIIDQYLLVGDKENYFLEMISLISGWFFHGTVLDADWLRVGLQIYSLKQAGCQSVFTKVVVFYRRYILLTIKFS